MSKGPLLLLWLVAELGWLFLMSAASELTVTGFLGQSVTLPCLYSSWSQRRISMCWGKGSCPKSKCGQELVYKYATAMTSSKSSRYNLWGNMQEGDLSLTISKTNEGDSGLYCCRIEVPGWFNDVKKNIRLELVRAPTTTITSRITTTRRVTTATPRVTTATTLFPTTVMTTPDLTTGTPLETRITSVLSTTTTTCPLTMSSSLPEGNTGLLPTDTVTEGLVITEGLEAFPHPSDSSGSTKAPSTAPPLLTSEASDRSITAQSKDEPSEREQVDKHTSSLITAAGLGLLLLTASLLAYFLRGKVTRSNCLQKHKRLDHAGERQDVLNDAQHARDDEDGLFTL